MKLVDILARDLEEWCEWGDKICQDYDGFICSYEADADIGFVNGDWNGASGDPIQLVELADDFRTSIVTRAQWQAAVDALKAESAPAWVGIGLPPVGTEVEAGFACEEFKTWHRGVCVAVGESPEGREDFCVVKFGNKLAMYTTEGNYMRPIRTPKQIEAEERSNAICKMSAIIGAPLSQLTHIEVLEALYDSGYRLEKGHD